MGEERDERRETRDERKERNERGERRDNSFQQSHRAGGRTSSRMGVSEDVADTRAGDDVQLTSLAKQNKAVTRGSSD